MQAEQLLAIIRDPRKITAEEVKALRQLLYQYPYFQLVCTLLAKAAYDQDATKAQGAIQLAAVYAPDRSYLKLLLEDKITFATPQQEMLPAPAAASFAPPSPQVQPRQETEQPEFINSYISTICNRAAQKITKTKSLEQLDTIKNFIQQGNRFKPVAMQEMDLEASQVDLAKASTTLHDDLLTESLAQVMLKQGKLQCALAIYHKLQLKFPEKKAYFSALAEELKRAI